jgi:hypothetical protein
MKKTLRKIALSRETLRHLDDTALALAEGAETGTATLTCAGGGGRTCDSCATCFVTCYVTCKCP